jgi:Ca-activated chloride channel family protein
MEKIRQSGIRVIIVGVGSDGPMPVPIYDENTGQLTGYMQKDGQPVTTQIDVGALENLASQTGGTYIQLVAGKPLDIHWASTLAGSHTEKHESQVYQYPLGLAMLLVFGLFVRGLLPSRQKRN